MSFIMMITFYSTLLLSPMLIVSSSNFIIMWMSLEISTFSFLPLIYSSSQSAFSTMKYFFIQSIASVMILASFFSYTPSFSISLLFIALMLKLGLAPFHFWLPKLVYSLRPTEILLLLIWQKIGPLYLTTFLPLFNQPIKVMLGLISVGVGSFLGLKQTQWKQIFTFSSISHLGWLFISMTFSIWSFLIYFLIYSIAFIQVMISSPSKFINSSIFSFSSSSLISLLMILSLAGLPPMLGFMTKLMVLFYLVTSPLMALVSILLLAFSMVSMYFYLKIFFSLTLLYSNGELMRNKMFVVSNIIFFISLPLLLNF